MAAPEQAENNEANFLQMLFSDRREERSFMQIYEDSGLPINEQLRIDLEEVDALCAQMPPALANLFKLCLTVDLETQAAQARTAQENAPNEMANSLANTLYSQVLEASGNEDIDTAEALQEKVLESLHTMQEQGLVTFTDEMTPERLATELSDEIATIMEDGIVSEAEFSATIGTALKSMDNVNGLQYAKNEAVQHGAAIEGHLKVVEGESLHVVDNIGRPLFDLNDSIEAYSITGDDADSIHLNNGDTLSRAELQEILDGGFSISLVTAPDANGENDNPTPIGYRIEGEEASFYVGSDAISEQSPQFEEARLQPAEIESTEPENQGPAVENEQQIAQQQTPDPAVTAAHSAP